MSSTPSSAGPQQAAARALQRRASDQSSGPGVGLSAPANPDTPKEAAEQFEKVLVRQFVDVMTEDMYSSSLAGDGGKNWMSSQRDRQRKVVTDMITNQLSAAGDLQIAETLMQSWGVEASADESDSAETADEPSPDFVDPLPEAPTDASSSPNRSQIDHAV